MGFEPTERALEISARIDAFMQEHILPREHEYEARNGTITPRPEPDCHIA